MGREGLKRVISKSFFRGKDHFTKQQVPLALTKISNYVIQSTLKRRFSNILPQFYLFFS